MLSRKGEVRCRGVASFVAHAPAARRVFKIAEAACQQSPDCGRTTGVTTQNTGVLASRRASALCHWAARCEGAAVVMCNKPLAHCKCGAALKWQAWQVVHWFCTGFVSSVAASCVWQGWFSAVSLVFSALNTLLEAVDTARPATKSVAELGML